MAYAEKRGKYWRSRYKRPDGTWASSDFDDRDMRFTSRQDAEEYGEGKEAAIRSRQWRDPRDDITLRAFVDDQWLPAQDLNYNTIQGYRRLLRLYILPAFGDRPLSTLTDELEIQTWERTCAPRLKVEPKRARTLLGTILSDAVPRYLDHNPARRPSRRRGRAAGRKSHRKASVEVPTPLQVLLVAERAAVLSGHADELIRLVTIAYTGMRWGEVVGLPRRLLKLSAIHVEQQLHETEGRFLLEPPKYDSYRVLDLPPFLSALLSRQVQDRPAKKCGCPAVPEPKWAEIGVCTGDRYVFYADGYVHARRSNYARQWLKPGSDGAWLGKGGKRPWAARPVLVDMAAGFPGRPLIPAWPYAVPGRPWEPPRGQGRTQFDQVEGLELASWVPVFPGLYPHLLRHTHATWMEEDGVPEVLREERMGHEQQGIKATYAHVTAGMREQLAKALQARWETSLAQRKAIWPSSSVPLLDELLGGVGDDLLKIVSQASPTAVVLPLHREA